jgi:hypothetical protein
VTQPDDPYRDGTAQPRVAPLGSATRWVFAAVAITMILGVLGGVGLMIGAFVHKNEFGVEDQDMLLASVIALCASILLLYVQVGVAVAWLRKVWGWLPPEQRWTKHWKSWITPSQAGFFLLVPYFHWYWMFVINLGLCDALDRMRPQHPASAPPRGLVMAAMICQIAQLFVPIPVAGALWLVYMSRIERVIREMSAAP